MIRRSSLLAVAGLVSGIWLAGSFTSLPLGSAQPTQTEIKNKAKQGAKKGQERWQSMHHGSLITLGIDARFLPRSRPRFHALRNPVTC